MNQFIRIKTALRAALFRLGFACLSGVLFLTACGQTSYLQMAQEQQADAVRSEAAVSASIDSTVDAAQPVAEELTAETIVVQIVGAVARPGVYTLPADARVAALVEAAGGLLPEAEERQLNQARHLNDGEMIIVYTAEEAAASGTEKGAEEGRININTADAAALQTLPGIGEGKAQAIIEWRTEHGSFGSAEEIMQVPGIKEGIWRQIQDKITVGP